MNSTLTENLDAVERKLNEFNINIDLNRAAHSSDHVDTPWFVKLLSIGAGWLAAVFMVIFIGILIWDNLNNTVGLIVMSTLCIGFAWFNLRSSPTDFAEHLSLASSFVGQLLLAYVIDQNTKLLTTWFLVLLMEFSLLLLISNTLHRYACGLGVSFATGMIFHLVGWHAIYPSIALVLIASIALTEFKVSSLSASLMPIAYGFALQFLFPMALGLFSVSSVDYLTVAPAAPHWVADISMTLVLASIVLIIISRYSLTTKTMLAGLIAALITGLVSTELSGITACCAIVILGYAHSNRMLTAIGFVSLLIQTTFYYYNLESTLLIKSASLAGLGVALLVIRFALLTVFKSTTPLPEHAESQQQAGGDHE